eukprot:10349200-Lingulodinium_polyedra.AAC.1
MTAATASEALLSHSFWAKNAGSGLSLIFLSRARVSGMSTHVCCEGNASIILCFSTFSPFSPAMLSTMLMSAWIVGSLSFSAD